MPQKPKAKAAPKKAATAKPAPKKMTQTTLKAKPAAKKKAKAASEDEMSDVHMSDADSILSHTPPKAKTASGPKRAGSKPLADVENESFGGDAASDAPGKTGNASDKYQKVSYSIQQVRKCPKNNMLMI